MSDDAFRLTRLVKIRLLHPDAKLPTVSEGNVGFDICSVDDVKLEPGKVTKVYTGIAMADDMGFSWTENQRLRYGRHGHKNAGLVPFFKIEGRSGMASKGIFPVGGIIDPSYRGEICVLLFNSTDRLQFFSKNDRIAQLVCYHSLAPLMGSQILFQEVKDAVPSDRGDKGFGSSGA